MTGLAASAATVSLRGTTVRRTFGPVRITSLPAAPTLRGAVPGRALDTTSI